MMRRWSNCQSPAWTLPLPQIWRQPHQRASPGSSPEAGCVSVPPLTEESLRHAIPYVPTSVVYACIKRVVDFVGHAIGLLLLSPIMAICALLIKLHDGGPVFFRQTRVGERGELFRIVKFRSMVKDADAMKAAMMQLNEHSDDRTFKIFNDPRT